MARVPDPRRGLVFRYGYVWIDDWLKGKVDPAKDRPVCIIVQVTRATAGSLGAVGGDKAADGDVVLFPITRSPPLSGQFAVELGRADKVACGLDADTESWVIVSEYNIDIWPSPDMALVPRAVPPRFEYGYAPPGLMKRISEAFRTAYATGKSRGLSRK